jgi:hypothetical protein
VQTSETITLVFEKTEVPYKSKKLEEKSILEVLARAMQTSSISRRTDPLSQAANTDRKVMENMVSENLRQRCARLGVRFDGEFSGLFWFADKKEDERSNGAGFVIKAGLAEPERLLEEKLCEIRQRFRAPGVLRG